MISVIKYALLAQILLLALTEFASSEDSKPNEESLVNDKALARVIPDKGLREKFQYFFDHYPALQDDKNSGKAKSVLRSLGIKEEKHRGKNRSILDWFAKWMTPQAYREKQFLKNCHDNVCKCKDPEACEAVICPILPADLNQCAQFPTCHPFCQLEIIKHPVPGPVATATNPPKVHATSTSSAPQTSTSTTTGAPKSSTTSSTTAKVQINPWPEAEGHPAKNSAHHQRSYRHRGHHERHRHHHEHHHHQLYQSGPGGHDDDEEDDDESCFPTEPWSPRQRNLTVSCCVKCQLLHGYNKKPMDYNYDGLYYFNSALEAKELNSTFKQDVLKVISDVPADKFDPKMKEIMNDLLAYFGDKKIADGKKGGKHNRVGADQTDLGKAGAAILGNFAEHYKKQKEREDCQCPNNFCPPKNLERCEGSCMNNPGCPIGQCRCRGHSKPPMQLPATMPVMNV